MRVRAAGRLPRRHQRCEVGHFSAIAIRPDARGQGLGSALTAWATRRLFREGYDLVTLGLYAGNTAARRMYDRLGFTGEHRFTSGKVAFAHPA